MRRESTELGGADGCVVLWVREEDYPVVTDELVEVDGALSGLGLEVRGGAAQTESLVRHLAFCSASLEMLKRRKHEGWRGSAG